MTQRLLYQSATYEAQPALPSSDQGAGRYISGISAPIGHGHGKDVHTLLVELTQSLTVLSSACELVLEGKALTSSAQTTRVWLHPNARQAEAAMHDLRDLQLTKSPALTELSQCLTVLVLAADMLVQGHLSGAEALPFYDLLRRNAAGAMKSLNELRTQLEPSVPIGV